MQYYFYPPFFSIEPQTSFDQAWEAFCLTLLCLEHATDAIRRLAPPDYGADLLWEKEQVLYQCKATEHGQAGSFTMKNIEKSIQTALDQRAQLHWKRYVLCTNADLTGSQQARLKSFLPEIEFLQPATWTRWCQKFHREIASRFRIAVSVTQERVLRELNEAYLRMHQTRFDLCSDASLLRVIAYSRRRDYMLELPFPETCTVSDVLTVLQEIFRLPPPEQLHLPHLSVELVYTLAIDGVEAANYRNLIDLLPPGQERTLVTLCETTLWCKESYPDLSISALEHVAHSPQGWQVATEQTIDATSYQHLQQYDKDINVSIQRTVQTLTGTPEEKV